MKHSALLGEFSLSASPLSAVNRLWQANSAHALVVKIERTSLEGIVNLSERRAEEGRFF